METAAGPHQLSLGWPVVAERTVLRAGVTSGGDGGEGSKSCRTSVWWLVRGCDTAVGRGGPARAGGYGGGRRWRKKVAPPVAGPPSGTASSSFKWERRMQGQRGGAGKVGWSVAWQLRDRTERSDPVQALALLQILGYFTSHHSRNKNTLFFF